MKSPGVVIVMLFIAAVSAAASAGPEKDRGGRQGADVEPDGDAIPVGIQPERGDHPWLRLPAS